MAIELFGSRVSTCLISILLIVYGSFRSLNMEQEAREKERKRQSESSNNLLTNEPISQEQSMSRLFVNYSALILSQKKLTFLSRRWICNARRHTCSLLATGCINFITRHVLLLRFHANALHRLYSE